LLPPELLTMGEGAFANAAGCDGLVPGRLHCAMGRDFGPQISTMHSAVGREDGQAGLQLCAHGYAAQHQVS